jgi:hypothetical protein
MSRKIQVIVDVKSDSVKFATDQTLTLTQQVRLLYKELQKIPEGTKEWRTLQKTYNDTKDNLDKVNVKSKELFGTLSTLPGPVGDFSAKLQGGIDLLKVFSSFTLKDLAASFRGVTADIVQVFTNLGGGKKILQETTKATADTTTTLSNFSLAAANVAAATTNASTAATVLKGGVYGLSVAETEAIAATRGLTVANTALAGAEQTAAVATNTLSVSIKGLMAATGIGLLIALVIDIAGRLMDYFDSSKRAEKAANDFSDAIKRQNELLEGNLNQIDFESKKKLLQAKIANKSEEELTKIQQDGLTERYNKIRDANSAALQEQKNLANRVGKYAKISDEERAALLEKNLENITKLGAQESKAREAVELNSLENEAKIAEKGREKKNGASTKQTEREISDRKQALDQITKGEEDAFRATLAVREREEYEINQKYAALIAIATKYGQDTTILKTGLEAELKVLREKYNKEELDAQYKLSQDLIEDELKNLEQYRTLETTQAELRYAQGLISEEEYQAALYQIKVKYSTTEEERKKAEIDFLEFAKGKQKEYEDTVKSANQAIADSYQTMASSIGSSFSEIARLFEQGSDLQKVFAIIGVLINAAAAIGKIRTSTAEAVADFSKTIATGTATVASGVALLSNPITAVVGAAQIAAGKAAIATGTAGIATAKSASAVQQIGVGISSAAQIAAITSAGKSKTAGSAASGGGQAPTPAFNGTVTVPAPVIGASQASQSGTLGQTIAGAVMEGNSRSRPIQTYVVGDQISTQQQLDRRISVAAKMAG